LAGKQLGLLINFHVALIKDGITRIINGYKTITQSRQEALYGILSASPWISRGFPGCPECPRSCASAVFKSTGGKKPVAYSGLAPPDDAQIAYPAARRKRSNTPAHSGPSGGCSTAIQSKACASRLCRAP